MNQNSKFLKNNLSELILSEIDGEPLLKEYIQKLETDIKGGRISITTAVEKLYQAYIDSIRK